MKNFKRRMHPLQWFLTIGPGSKTYPLSTAPKMNKKISGDSLQMHKADLFLARLCELRG